MTVTASRIEIQSQPVPATVVQLVPAPRECSHMRCHETGEYAHPAGQGLRACLTHLLLASARMSAL